MDPTQLENTDQCNIILGLDCSTTCCGFSFSQGGKVLKAGFIDIKKKENNKDKAYFIIEYLKTNFRDLLEKCRYINLEGFLSGFAFGKTTQQVIIKLARFNGLMEFVLEKSFNIPVNLVSPSSARKFVIGKSFQKGIKTKEFVRNSLLRKHPDLKKFETNGKKSFDVRNYDMYDAILLSLYCV